MSSTEAADDFRRFSYAELEAATAGFSPVNKIGRGGFGDVFRGALSDGTAVAVKRIKEAALLNRNSDTVLAAFLEEARLMGVASQGNAANVAGGHWPLLPLLGICAKDTTQLCLVTPRMARGSLAEHIGHPEGTLTSGRLRVAAALDAARGVAALHALRPRLLHRDIKPENVLLDEGRRAYVADYGLSRLLTGDATSMVTGGVYGTPGYVAPETLALGRYSVKVRGDSDWGDRGKEGGGVLSSLRGTTGYFVRNLHQKQ